MPLHSERPSSRAEHQNNTVEHVVKDIEANIIPPKLEEFHFSPAEKVLTEKIKDKDVRLQQNGSTMLSTSEEENLVTWDGPNDINNPMKWSTGYKCLLTMMFGSMTFSVTFASSVFSTAIEETARIYDVSTEVTTLGVSLFVLVPNDFAHDQRTSYLTCPGLCHRSIDLGPLLRIVWQKAPSLLCLRHLLHFPNTSRCWVKHTNHSCLQIRWGTLLCRTPCSCGRGTCGFLGSGKQGCSSQRLCRSNVRWPCGRASHRRLYYKISSWMAVDDMDHTDYELIVRIS